jgi:integrase
VAVADVRVMQRDGWQEASATARALVHSRPGHTEVPTPARTRSPFRPWWSRCWRSTSPSGPGPGPDGLVFLSEQGQPLSRHNRRWWRDACLAAGLPPGTHPHDRRHAGLTLAAQSGATLKELMALAGHRSPRAAMIYQHAAEHRAAILAEAVSRRLERPANDEQSA